MGIPYPYLFLPQVHYQWIFRIFGIKNTNYSTESRFTSKKRNDIMNMNKKYKEAENGFQNLG